MKLHFAALTLEIKTGWWGSTLLLLKGRKVIRHCTVLTCSLNIHIATLHLVIVKVSVFFLVPCVAPGGGREPGRSLAGEDAPSLPLASAASRPGFVLGSVS